MFNWQILKNFSKHSQCDFAQDFLLAAFDGEANDAQLLRAAQHRADCVCCQTMWSEWEQTRDLFCAAPVPMAPAGLKSQILTTCRALPDADFANAPNEILSAAIPTRADLVEYLEAANDEFSVARLALFAPEVAAPLGLSHRILERTSQSETRAGLWPIAREFFQAGSTPGQRAARWGAGLAVPALAAWLIFAAQTSSVQAPAIQNTRVAATAPNTRPDLQKLAPAAPERIVVLPSIKKALPKIAVLPNSKKSSDIETSEVKTPDDEKLQAIFARAEIVSLKSPGSLPRAARKKPVVKKTPSNISPKIRPRTIPLVDKSILIQPRISHVALKPSALRVRFTPTHEGTSLRISSPVPAASDTPLRFADARFADEDFDETMSDIAQARDNRPEDLGRALDEYSASLLTENTEDDEDDWG